MMVIPLPFHISLHPIVLPYSRISSNYCEPISLPLTGDFCRRATFRTEEILHMHKLTQTEVCDCDISQNKLFVSGRLRSFFFFYD